MVFDRLFTDKEGFRNLFIASTSPDFGQHFPLPVSEFGEDRVIGGTLDGKPGKLCQYATN